MPSAIHVSVRGRCEVEAKFASNLSAWQGGPLAAGIPVGTMSLGRNRPVTYSGGTSIDPSHCPIRDTFLIRIVPLHLPLPLRRIPTAKIQASRRPQPEKLYFRTKALTMTP